MNKLINDLASVVPDALHGFAAAHPEVRVELPAGQMEVGVGIHGEPGLRREPVAPYVTSLDMAGCSIMLLHADDDLRRLWDAPVRTAALRWGA